MGEERDDLNRRSVNDGVYHSAGLIFMEAGKRDPRLIGKIVMFANALSAYVVGREHPAEGELEGLAQDLENELSRLREIATPEERERVIALAERGIDNNNGEKQ